MDSADPPETPFWKRPMVLAAAFILVAAGGWVAYDRFAPEAATHVEEELAMDAVVLSEGEFSGADRAHSVSGRVQWVDQDGQYSLFLSDYDATNGPDVYFFLSTTPDGDYGGGDVVRLPVPGGAKHGQATLRGDFHVPLPDGLEPGDYRSIIVWCDDFSVKFGHAPLT